MSVRPWLADTWALFQRRLEDGKVAHALLLQGPEGTGKLELATTIMARLLCAGDSEFACGECRSCALAKSGAHPDCFQLHPEEGKHQILIEQVRSMIDALSLTTSFSPRKVALISPAEALNKNSANALLKSLEEPPGETVLILVSHDPSRLPVTIRSRCQAMTVSLPPAEQALEWLTTGCKLDPASAAAALDAAGGSPVRAAEMAANGEVETHRNLQSMLSSLLERPEQVSAVAAKLAEVDSSALWTWLSRNSAAALRAALSGERPDWLSHQVVLRQAALARLQQAADRNRVFSRSAVRQDLLLQEWLIKWSQISA